MNALLLALLAVNLLALPPTGEDAAIAAMDRAMQSWDTEGLGEFEAGPGPEAKVAAALAAFLDGDFAVAQRSLSELESRKDLSAPLASRVQELLSLVDTWSMALGGLAKVAAQSCTIFASAGQIEILAGLSLEVVGSTSLAVPGLPPRREAWRLVFLDDQETFASLAGIDQKKIVASGTMAVTRFRTVLIQSPSLVPEGYDWQSVLAHEILHMQVRRSCPSAPIWFEEGLAWLCDGSWRAGAPAVKPQSELERGLLASAARNRTLRTWEELSGSFALAPGPWQAALSFMQAGAAIRELLLDRRQRQAGICADLAAGMEFGQSLRKRLKFDEAQFRKAAELKWRKPAPWKETQRAEKYFGTAREDEGLADRVRLADMLWGRGHRDAAGTLLEERGAEQTDDLQLGLRLCVLRFLRGDAAGALAASLELGARYGDSAPLLYVTALAARRLGQHDVAVSVVERAIRLQPFAPDIVLLRAELRQETDKGMKSGGQP